MQIRTNDKSVETPSAQTYQIELTEDQIHVAANVLPEILEFINCFPPKQVNLLLDMAASYQPNNKEAVSLAGDIVALVVEILHNREELRDISRKAAKVIKEDKPQPVIAE